MNRDHCKEFTIYRHSWRRGGDSRELMAKFGTTSLLHTSNGLMCCLGQCAIQLGVKPSAIRDIGEPCDVYDERELLLDVLLYEDDGRIKTSELTREAMNINDDEIMTDTMRETRLIILFKQQGHSLTFLDGTAPEVKL